jgi:hypothetical protein
MPRAKFALNARHCHIGGMKLPSNSNLWRCVTLIGFFIFGEPIIAAFMGRSWSLSMVIMGIVVAAIGLMGVARATLTKIDG